MTIVLIDRKGREADRLRAIPHPDTKQSWKQPLTLLALILATSAHANMSAQRHQTFNASILNFSATEFAVDLENWRHGTHAYGYRVGDRLMLKGSRRGFNGRVTVYQITGDVLHVRYNRVPPNNVEEAVRLRITRIGRP